MTNSGRPEEGRVHCERCGTCCRQGGPALHSEDRGLLADGVIGPADLVTVRSGEPVHMPLEDRIVPAATEFIKLAGQGGSWHCLFLDEATDGCRIYRQRPLECRLLFCRDTAPLEEVMGRDLLRRSDLIAAEDPMIAFIDRLEEECPYDLVNELLASAGDEVPAELNLLVRRDLAIRQAFLNRFAAREAEELFLFGRPLFLVLAPYGYRLRAEDGLPVLARS